MSIKGGERDKRLSTGKIQTAASRQDHTATKQFKKYPSAGANAVSVFLK